TQLDPNASLLAEQGDAGDRSPAADRGGREMLKRGLMLAGLLGIMVSVSLAQAQPPPSKAAKAQEARAVMGACKPDIARFCSQVPPGEGRIKACMKQHLPELSEPCKEALFQAWLHD